MPTSRLTLFGRFALCSQARVINLPTRKAEALLALLSLSPGRSAGREHVVRLLWPDVPRAQGRHSLRQTIHAVRRALDAAESGTLVTTRDFISLVAPELEIDVVTFVDALSAGTPEKLDCAIELYRGELLEGVLVREPPFDQWLHAQRARLGHLAFDAHLRRLNMLRSEGHSDRALQVAHRLLAIDPRQEEVRRIVEQLLRARTGDTVSD